MSFTFRHAPRISSAHFAAILKAGTTAGSSPCAPMADQCYTIITNAGLDPALLLAIFAKESQYGCTGLSVTTKNWGNVRTAFRPDLAIGHDDVHNFAVYGTWQNSLRDLCERLNVRYIDERGLKTPEAVFPVYAPASENDTQGYIDFVNEHVAKWMSEDQQTMPVITTDYRKDTVHPPGYGYGRNVGTDASPLWVADRTGTVESIIVHSTNGNPGSSFRGECEFIRDSPDVGIQDEIAKDGTLAFILPANVVAWHAGATIPGFSNNRSYGIELHHAIGETYTQAQFDTLTWRVKLLIAKYAIPKDKIETHRAAAVPHGRKVDPSDWSDADFYHWRDSLYGPAPVPHPKVEFLKTVAAAKLRQGPGTTFPTVLVMPAGETAGYDDDTPGESINGNSVWKHRADGRGFVWSGLLEAA